MAVEIKLSMLRSLESVWLRLGYIYNDERFLVLKTNSSRSDGMSFESLMFLYFWVSFLLRVMCPNFYMSRILKEPASNLHPSLRALHPLFGLYLQTFGELGQTLPSLHLGIVYIDGYI